MTTAECCRCMPINQKIEKMMVVRHTLFIHSLNWRSDSTLWCHFQTKLAIFRKQSSPIILLLFQIKVFGMNLSSQKLLPSNSFLKFSFTLYNWYIFVWINFIINLFCLSQRVDVDIQILRLFKIMHIHHSFFRRFPNCFFFGICIFTIFA